MCNMYHLVTLSQRIRSPFIRISRHFISDTHTYMYVYVYMYVCMCTCMYSSAMIILMCIHTHVHTCVHMCTHVYVLQLYRSLFVSSDPSRVKITSPQTHHCRLVAHINSFLVQFGRHFRILFHRTNVQYMQKLLKPKVLGFELTITQPP